jgi:hypothetical protein
MITVKYESQADDRSVAADVAHFQFLRQQTLSERIRLTQAMTRRTRSLAIAAIKRQYPALQRPDAERILVAKAILQEKYTDAFISGGRMEDWQQQDSMTLTQQLHGILEGLGIGYYLGGGLAAAVWGEPRVTTDADIVLQLAASSPQLDLLITTLEGLSFYCPPAAVEEVKAGTQKTISVTHQLTTNNADLIVPNTDPFERSQMARRLKITDIGLPFWVCTAEDIILQKLVWSRRSRSEKQWRQVLGVLKVQQSLDFEYLDEWAEQLKLSDRLRQAYEAVGL